MRSALDCIGREPSAQQRQQLAELATPLQLWQAPTLNQWAEAVMAYQGQLLVAADCCWPLPPHQSLPLPAAMAPTAAPAAADADEALDLALLADYRDMLGDETLSRMLGLLRQHLPAYLQQLGQAWADGDELVLRRAAHTLKGSLATVGLKRLRNCAEVLQTAAAGPQQQAALTTLLQWCGRDLALLSQRLPG